MTELPLGKRMPKMLDVEADPKTQNESGTAPDEVDSLDVTPTANQLLECPPELPPLAREEWNRIVGELTALEVLSRFDRGPLAVYCGAYALWADATEALQKFGTMIKSPTGYPVQSPYVAVVNRQAEIMMRMAGEFGFTPAARSRTFSFTKGNSMLLEFNKRPKDESSDW
jgi:P27 family predicted phage terminase small subunit